MLLSTLAAALLSATVTNTETVHDLAVYDGHVVACTEGGLELFTRSGRPVRTLTVEDGLPSHFCRALEVGAKWHALLAVGSMNAEPYRAALGWLVERLPTGPTYTAFTERYLGTADGRVLAPGLGRTWTVPGPVLLLEEAGDTLRVATALVPGGALVGTLLGAAYDDAASGTVHPLPRLADPRVYALLVEGDTVLFGTEGGLTWRAWSAPAAVTRR